MNESMDDIYDEFYGSNEEIAEKEKNAWIITAEGIEIIKDHKEKDIPKDKIRINGHAVSFEDEWRFDKRVFSPRDFKPSMVKYIPLLITVIAYIFLVSKITIRLFEGLFIWFFILRFECFTMLLLFGILEFILWERFNKYSYVFIIATILWSVFIYFEETSLLLDLGELNPIPTEIILVCMILSILIALLSISISFLKNISKLRDIVE